MSAAARFLYALANLLSTGRLYGPDHPARRNAFQAAFADLRALLEEDGRPVFSFVDDEVVYGERPLRDMKSWDWSHRFAEAGIQRLEFAPAVEPEELEGFVSELARRLEIDMPLPEPVPHPHIRYGSLGLQRSKGGSGGGRRGGQGGEGEGGGGGAGTARRRVDPDAPPAELEDESEAIRWLNEEAASGRVHTDEAEAVVRGLSLAMHGSRQLVAPLVEIKSTDQYTTNHCINVSILSMSLAEFLELADGEVRAIGVAALLHDIGKTRTPLEVLNKPGKLTEEERRIIEQHTVEGAKILLQQQETNVLPAVVAYEHHMHWNGGGYPPRHYDRKPHRFSRMVQICDVYDALRTRRPFRAPLSADAARDFIGEHAGTQFDPDLASAFLKMLDQWEPGTVPTHRGAEGEQDDEAEVLTRLPGAAYDADTEAEQRAVTHN